MLDCNFEIELNGFTKSFNSQQELNDFLTKNYTKIQAARQISNVQFSKNTHAKDNTLAKIELIKQENAAIKSKFDAYGNRVELNISDKYTGVTRMIDDLRIDGKRVITPFDISDYRSTNILKVRDEIAADPANRGLSAEALDDLASDRLDETVAGWKILGKMGTDLHGIAQLFFNDGVTDVDQLLTQYSKPLNRELMERYVTYLSEIKQEMIDKSGDPDMSFISEFAVHDEATKMVGIIDLVGIDKDGNAYLGDFKTSYKSVDDWDRGKTMKSQYQLAFYQQLMMSKGIPVSDLYIFPLYLMDTDIDNQQVGNIRRESTIPLKQSLLTDNRRIYENARSVLPVDISKFLEYKSDTQMQEQMQSMFGITIGYDNIDAQIPEFMNTRVKEIDGVRYFYDDITKKQMELKGSILEQQDIVRAYLNNAILELGYTTSKRAEVIQKLMERGEYSDLVTTGKKERQVLLRKTYARYCDKTWDLMSAPELTAQGILVFRDKYRGVMEFVIDSSLNLKATKKLKYGDSLLGQFYKDSTLIKNDTVIPAKATEANIAAMKIMMFLNNNYATINATGSTLGIIRAVNTTTHGLDLVGINNDEIISNYKELTRKLNLPYNLDKLKQSSFEDLLYSQVVHTLQDQNVDRDELSLIEDIRTTYFKASITDRIADLKKIQKKWKSKKDINDQDIDLSTRSGYVYALLNGTILSLQGIKIGFEQDINKISLNRSEILSTPLELEAIETIRAAQFPIKQAMQAMSNNYVEFNGKMRRVFEDYYKYKGVSMLVGDHLNAFDNLFNRDATGKLDKNMTFKNPDDPNARLDAKEREFLRIVLNTFNNVLRPGNQDEAKATGDFYNVPLIRANSVSRIHNQSYLDAVKANYDNILNFHNFFKEDQEENQKKFEEMLEAHNSFNFSANPDVRERLLTEHPVGHFDTNVELILGQLMFADIRKKAYDQVLPTVYAVRMTSKLLNKGFINNPLDNMDRYIKEYVKVAVFDEKILEPAHERIAKPVMAVKQAVTMLQLAATPLNLIKETMQGQFNNFSKLMAGQYGEKGATLKSYNKALGYILNESPDFINNVTMIEELNHLYGMANMDRHQLADKMKLSKQGITNFGSRWMLWASGAPDYVNRMSLFIAQMIEDGAFEAHSMVNGILVYDWTKDKRFSNYAAGRTSAPDFNAQRSLYLRILQEHNKDNTALGKPELLEGDALPRAYTTKEQQSLKMFSDYVHGPYDHEGKIKLNHMLLGGLFIQFKTWLTAKKQQYTMAGDKYAVGHWAQVLDLDGKPLYLKTDSEGNTIITPEVTDVQHMEWKGRYMEGLFQSIVRTYGEFKKSQYSVTDLMDFLKQDDTIKGNFKMMGFDLALFTIFSLIIKGMIDWGEIKKDDPWMAAMLRAGVNSTSDMNPWANIKTALDPKALTATISTVTQTTEDTFGAVVGDKNFGSLIRTFGLGRTIDDVAGITSSK